MSTFTLGTAARRILGGDIDAASLQATIGSCAWCQVQRMNRECWHADAEVLLEHGLRAAARAAVAVPVQVTLPLEAS